MQQLLDGRTSIYQGRSPKLRVS